MASTDQVKMKAQPMISCQLPVTPAGKAKRSSRPKSILLG